VDGSAIVPLPPLQDYHGMWTRWCLLDCLILLARLAASPTPFPIRGFSLGHSGGLNMAMCDGSVDFIAYGRRSAGLPSNLAIEKMGFANAFLLNCIKAGEGFP